MDDHHRRSNHGSELNVVNFGQRPHSTMVWVVCMDGIKLIFLINREDGEPAQNLNKASCKQKGKWAFQNYHSAPILTPIIAVNLTFPSMQSSLHSQTKRNLPQDHEIYWAVRLYSARLSNYDNSVIHRYLVIGMPIRTRSYATPLLHISLNISYEPWTGKMKSQGAQYFSRSKITWS